MTDEDILQRIDNLNKPKGSLGLLENIAFQICKIQDTLKPVLSKPTHILFGADHGIEYEGVSASPRAVTYQQMINFTRGGGGVNLFCNQHDFNLKIVDVGVDYDLSTHSDIIQKKIRRGTRNFLYEAAINSEECEYAKEIAKELISDVYKSGCNVVCFGEMGIGNTTAASAWIHLLTKISLNDCIGKGSGLNDEGLIHKKKVLIRAIDRFKQSKPNYTVEDIIMYFGGYEMITALYSMIEASKREMLVLVDGFIMTAVYLATSFIYQGVKDTVIFGHCSGEKGHKLILDYLGVKPILDIGMRLGEGTGALCAYPIIKSAVLMMTEMNDFDNAKIDKYF